ncbi:arylamine N-acetyltransferase [Hazenella sp. IB182357]|uniref:Arylamine N-acetyltransferase n=1 Tax=Polycladospora coralii TaxID=2771432 RepID=A0A926RU69_9BACL|nr:arylamine N-acetyltransferase [Polycladospora coralii]MBD1372568.1 arylamine N-acetyltransferase [Polycladospora coralii]MBS7531309.1 arylamine N-acetyltransferase [Polycladospora coralii]
MTKTIPTWTSRYLTYLKLGQESPTCDYLKRILTQHLSLVPFENISKLVRMHRSPDFTPAIIHPAEFVKQMEMEDLGGTCFTANYSLYHLLSELGYICKLIMLGTSHLGILVKLVEIGDEWLFLDCGSCAPFFKPIRFLDGVQEQVQFGHEIIYLEPIKASGMYHYRRVNKGKSSDNDWIFHIDQQLTDREIEAEIIRSYQPDKHFMQVLKCFLFQPEQGRSLSLSNNQFKIRTHTGDEEVYILKQIADIRAVVEQEFKLPRLPLEEAILVLEQRGIDIFADDQSTS